MEYIRTHLPEKGDDVAKIKNATMALHALNNLIVNTPGWNTRNEIKKRKSEEY